MTEQVQPVKRKVELELEFDTTQKQQLENRFQLLLELAEAVDAWRIFPRAFISVYMVLLYQTANWFMARPDPSTSQAGLISVVVGAGAAWFGLYTGSSKSKSK